MAKMLKCDDVAPGCKIIVEGRDVNRPGFPGDLFS